MSLLEELKRTDHLIRHRTAFHEPGQPILKLSSVTVRYENGAALKDLSFEVKEGEQLAVVGPNGAGKSTLFKVIAGVLTPSQGQVHVYGHEPGGHICIAYLTQRNQVDWSFPVSVADVVMMGRIGQIGLLHQPKARDWEIVYEALDTVQLSHLAKRQISQLSGGQQQRMFIARALAQEAELILMDEPLAGLDVNALENILALLERLRSQQVTIMVALHDLEMAARHFDRILLLNRRLVGLGPPAEVLVPERLMQAYGGHLHLIPTQEGILALGDTCCDDGEWNE